MRKLMWQLCLFVVVLTRLDVFANTSSLRHPSTECGLYFSQNSKTHGSIIARLNELDQLQAPLSQLDVNERKDQFYLVGSPFQKSKRIHLENQVKKELNNLGYHQVPVHSIRRLTQLTEQLTGIFFEHSDGNIEKIAALNEKSIIAALSQKMPDGRFIVAGMPLFGKTKAKFKSAIKNSPSTHEVKTISKAKLNFLHAKEDPVSFIREKAQQVRYFFPLKEDYVPPVSSEIKSASQKILTPGIITFTTLISQGQTLNILIPVTLVNAVNSFGIGTIRSTFGNWIRRSATAFPGIWMKNILVTSFFTATLYWAKSGSLETLQEAITIAGWQNLLATKWLSVLFTTAWRAPLNAAVFRWERYRSEIDESNELYARYAGAAFEKYTSYVMTQFFIYSIVAKESLLKVAYSANEGIHITSEHLQENEQVLLDMNVGHVVMAMVGATAMIMMNKFKALDKVAGIAVTFDKLESNLISTVKQPFSWLYKLFSKNLPRRHTIQLRGEVNNELD